MKGILFDFNGTLFDDTRFHIESWKRYFHDRFGIDFTREEVMRRFIGPDSNTNITSVFGDRFSPEEIKALSLEKEAVYRDVAREREENMRLIEGAPELLTRLAERNIPMAVATSSMIDNVEFYMHELGLERWFTLDRVVYMDGTLPTKPDPAFYTAAAARLNLLPGDCIVVEDSMSGIRSAVNAGAGRIICVDRTIGAKRLAAMPEVYAVIHDFTDFGRYIADLRNL